jgi:hypothetical protein
VRQDKTDFEWLGEALTALVIVGFFPVSYALLGVWGLL